MRIAGLVQDLQHFTRDQTWYDGTPESIGRRMAQLEDYRRLLRDAAASPGTTDQELTLLPTALASTDVYESSLLDLSADLGTADSAEYLASLPGGPVVEAYRDADEYGLDIGPDDGSPLYRAAAQIRREAEHYDWDAFVTVGAQQWMVDQHPAFLAEPDLRREAAMEYALSKLTILGDSRRSAELADRFLQTVEAAFPGRTAEAQEFVQLTPAARSAFGDFWQSDTFEALGGVDLAPNDATPAGASFTGLDVWGSEAAIQYVRDCAYQAERAAGSLAGRRAAYNPLSDPNTPYNRPKVPTGEEREYRELFPDGVPLRGELTPGQQAWLDKGKKADKAPVGTDSLRSHLEGAHGQDALKGGGVYGDDITGDEYAMRGLHEYLHSKVTDVPSHSHESRRQADTLCHNCDKPKSKHMKEKFDGKTVYWCEGPGSEKWSPGREAPRQATHFQVVAADGGVYDTHPDRRMAEGQATDLTNLTGMEFSIRPVIERREGNRIVADQVTDEADDDMDGKGEDDDRRVSSRHVATVTQADIDRAYDDDRYLGWGYLNARQSEEATPDLVARADKLALDEANRRGWTYDQFFQWLNSRDGRFFGDLMFGGFDDAEIQRQMPSLFRDSYESSRRTAEPKYEPGLGCPYCKWTGSKLKDREDHIKSKHPGKDPVLRSLGATSAPYYVRKKDDKFVVVNEKGEVKGTHGSREDALAQQAALYVNVPGAQEKAEEHHGESPDKPYHEKGAKKSASLGEVRCPNCGSTNIGLPVAEDAADYGSEDPEFVCQDCGYDFSQDEADDETGELEDRYSSKTADGGCTIDQPHCESCGSTDYEDLHTGDQGYTACCNELVASNSRDCRGHHVRDNGKQSRRTASWKDWSEDKKTDHLIDKHGLEPSTVMGMTEKQMDDEHASDHEEGAGHRESRRMAASESTPMRCNECGKNFKKKLSPNTYEVKCPGCGGYDTEPAEAFEPRKRESKVAVIPAPWEWGQYPDEEGQSHSDYVRGYEPNKSTHENHVRWLMNQYALSHEEAEAEAQRRYEQFPGERERWSRDEPREAADRSPASKVDEKRKVRILALAVQHYGADSTDAKAALDDDNFGMDTSLSDDFLARALAMYVHLKRNTSSRSAAIEKMVQDLEIGEAIEGMMGPGATLPSEITAIEPEGDLYRIELDGAESQYLPGEAVVLVRKPMLDNAGAPL